MFLFLSVFQAEEEALLLQQYAATGDGREFEQRVRSYVQQVLMVGLRSLNVVSFLDTRISLSRVLIGDASVWINVV